jgi:diadenylate cyclase
MPIDLLLHFKWVDVADILVISFITYRLFLLIRGTTAFQIVVGLLFLWVLQGAAQAVGLVLTSWFFQGAEAVAVLVIVVVFRNEIREVLIQTNPARFFFGHPEKTRKIGVSLIVHTALQLAKTRTGALLVLQNRDQLGGYLREGFALDGKLIPEILESIFAKQSPVHDGAAIIRGNRITRIGTFLPLTQREGLPQQYGTRHRAAIGLSEVSDAVVLVVSEERGEISVVHQGKVESIQEPEELEKTIGHLLLGVASKEKPQSRGRMWLTQAGGLLLTFLLVSTFWGVYSGRQISLISITTPLYFRNIPENLELKTTSAEKVEVQITGKRRLISALKPDLVRAFVDLGEINAGAHRLVLNSDNIRLPPGLDVARITPSTISLEMEQRIDKEVGIKPEIAGPPPAGYQVVKVSVSPKSVKINGPASILRGLSSLSTEPINLGDIQPQSGRKSVEVPLVLSPPSLQLLDGQSRQVQVSIQLQAQRPLPPKPIYYQVRAGDTLYDISRRYGVTLEELRRLNKLAPGAVIYPGQRLTIGEEAGK